MSNRTPREPAHRHSAELLRAVVASVVPERERGRYLLFARELHATLHRPPGPDFTRRTKSVVRKWFRRGLSGRLEWMIGERLLGRMYPAGSSRGTRD